MLPRKHCQHWEHISKIKDQFGSTLLLRAANDGMAVVAERLLSLAAHAPSTHVGSVASYVNEPNDMGWTALLLASQNGFFDIVSSIVDGAGGGANIDCHTRGAHITPLMLAATHGHVQVVEFLLEKKANPWTIAGNGLSCLDMVISARMKLGKKKKKNLTSHDEYRVETADKAEHMKASLDHIIQIMRDKTHGERLTKLA